MSSISVNTITDASGGATASINGYTPSASNMTGRNRIINGAMMIDQRNAGAQTTFSGYNLDRWTASVSSAWLNVQQNAGSVTPPAGFSNYAGMTSTVANSVGTTEYFLFQQGIEGYNIDDLRWGTSDAKTITLSFWVRSSLTGTFGVVFRNAMGGSTTRTYATTYTISSANTWEKKTITVTGDTSGTWATNNSCGLSVSFGLGVGSSYTTGTTNSWQGANYLGVSGATSVVGTSGATFYITGVQLEVGSSASEFEHRQYGQELALCQRYCIQTTYYGSATVSNGAMGSYGAGVAASNWMWGFVYFPTVMRAQPSVKTSDGAGNYEKLTIWTSSAGSTTHNISPYTLYATQDGFNFSDYSNAKNGVFIGGYLATAEL